MTFQRSSSGRNPAPNISVQPNIPHGDPADPGFNPTEKRKSALFGTKMNPQRHTYMHQFQTQYDDHNFVGDFPTPDFVAEREPAQIYKEQAVGLAIGYLQKHVQGFSLQATNWDELKETSWQLHGLENINEVKFALFDYLAENLIVKENKFRPRIEQRIRKSAARE